MLFRSFIGHRAGNIRADVPCLTHGDANLLNITVAEQVTLIDCDFTAIRYLLAELSALDEHVYLTAGIGLPPAFFAGYGRAVPADLLLAYRKFGCLRWLSSAQWKRWEVDRAMPASARRRLRRWHQRLLEWVTRMPALAGSGRSDVLPLKVPM
ncbi:MAG TPA: hypothetical protein VFP01_07370 [Propionibacteriaceae bacterium]|nr:hypothetical protein [Propionibacteriaceae bacterium]